MAIVDELSALRTSTLAAIEQAADTSALEEVRVAVLGKAGTLTRYLRGMGQVAKEERAAVGKAVNEVHDSLIALSFDNGLVEARSVVTVDGVDPFNQMIWKVRAGVGREIASFGVAGYHKASFRKFLHDML